MNKPKMVKRPTSQPRPAMFAAPDITSPAIRELLEMHMYCRPARSEGTTAFCARYLDNMSGMQTDKAGNRFLRVGTAPVLWSSHTDTVHQKAGAQRLAYGDGMLTLAGGSQSNCLGADDSAGVWIMRQMILRGVPGLYIFHDSEEVGGIGSAWIADKTPEMLHGIDYAIALDRRGTSSVITHQMGRCASDAFAEELALDLGQFYAPDDSGTFTDTANYTSLVPECTNLSVGYYGAHAASESLDVSFTAWLLERLCVLDVCALPVARNVDEGFYCDPMSAFGETDWGTLTEACWEDPATAARILEDWGITMAVFNEYRQEAKMRRK